MRIRVRGRAGLPPDGAPLTSRTPGSSQSASRHSGSGRSGSSHSGSHRSGSGRSGSGRNDECLEVADGRTSVPVRVGETPAGPAILFRDERECFSFDARVLDEDDGAEGFVRVPPGEQVCGQSFGGLTRPCPWAGTPGRV